MVLYGALKAVEGDQRLQNEEFGQLCAHLLLEERILRQVEWREVVDVLRAECLLAASSSLLRLLQCLKLIIEELEELKEVEQV